MPNDKNELSSVLQQLQSEETQGKGELKKNSKNKERKLKSFRLTNDMSINKKMKIFLISFFIFIIFIIIGNYHIVFNAMDPTKAFVFIKRPYFGFDDILGDINTCTTAPYYSVMSNHPSLCKALQNARYLESEENRDKRIKKEVQQELNDSISETDKCLKRCGLNYSDEYLRCMDACYLGL